LGRVVYLCVSLLAFAILGAANIRMRARHPYLGTAAGNAAALSGGHVAGAVPPSDTQATIENILTNEDIAAFGRVQMPSSVVKKLIRSQRHNFLIDARALVVLKKAGVTEDVILAMIEVTEASAASAVPATGVPAARVQVAATGDHRSTNR